MNRNLLIKNIATLKTLFLIIGCCFINKSVAQTEFFNSKIGFSKANLSTFYSSIVSDSSQVYFNANDYYLYAYDKKTGTLNWRYYLANKTNIPPIVHQNSILVGKHLSEYDNKYIQLNAKTGDTIQTLKIEALITKPFFKNKLMYCAAIAPEVGGAILAYDLDKNQIVWSKFIAHGSSIQPYFFQNKIIANAESDNWFEIDYNGKLIDTTCSIKSDLFIEDIKCVKVFRFLSHDGKEISEEFLQKYIKNFSEINIEYGENYTFILAEDTLLTLSDNRKLRSQIEISKLLPNIAIDENPYRKILKIEKNSIWFFYENNLVEFDYKIRKIIKTTDFSKWNPHQVLLDNDTLWLVSGNDGELNGFKIE